MGHLSETGARTMLIEIFADFSCPWCFLGRRRLGRALAAWSNPSAEIVWQPFRLNPELPAEGVDRDVYMRARFGDRSRLRAVQASLEEAGLRDGIVFAFDRARRAPNTMAAHRLMRFAAGYGKADRLADLLFSAFFESGQDIGDFDVLTARAAEAGLDPTEAGAFLNSRAEYDAVAAMDDLGRRSGITGVPYFIFDRRFALAGAQEPASFLPLFDALAAIDGETLASNA